MYKWKFSYFDSKGRLLTFVATLNCYSNDEARQWFETEGREQHHLDKSCKLSKCWITF